MLSGERKRSIAQLFCKRLFDTIAAVFFLIVLLPVFLMIGLVVKIGSRGPALFTQARYGQEGKLYRIIKFRTMGFIEESEISSEIQHSLKQDPSNFSTPNKQRINEVGKFLKKRALDELPQLINIFKGDMSFVGPRPITIEEHNQLHNEYQGYLAMKPGLTCFWQLQRQSSGRSIIEKHQLDMEYINNWNLMLDFKIIMRTMIVFFRMLTGAAERSAIRRQAKGPIE